MDESAESDTPPKKKRWLRLWILATVIVLFMFICVPAGFIVLILSQARGGRPRIAFEPPREVDPGMRGKWRGQRTGPIETDGANTWIMVWDGNPDKSLHDPDIWMIRSTDGGATWSRPSAINSDAASDSYEDLFPKVKSVSKGRWLAYWTRRRHLPNQLAPECSIQTADSSDGGLTWSDPRPIYDSVPNEECRTICFAEMASDGVGTCLLTWFREARDHYVIGSFPGRSISPPPSLASFIVTRSTDAGSTWAPPVKIAGAPFQPSSENWITPSIVGDPTGQWAIVWNEQRVGHPTGDDREVFVIRSRDRGLTWTSPEILNTDADTDGMREEGWPQIRSDAHGRWLVAWGGGSIAGSRILISTSDDGGATWTAPVTVAQNGHFGVGPDPFVTPPASDGRGGWLVGWSQHSFAARLPLPRWVYRALGYPFSTLAQRADPMVSYSSDGGATWSPSWRIQPLGNQVLRTTYSPPYLAADDNGRWGAVWYSSLLGAEEMSLFSVGQTPPKP